MTPSRQAVVEQMVAAVQNEADRFAAIPGSLSASQEARRLERLLSIVEGYADLSFSAQDTVTAGALLKTDDGQTYVVVDADHQLPIASTHAVAVVAVQFLRRQRALHVGDVFTITRGRPGEGTKHPLRIVQLW